MAKYDNEKRRRFEIVDRVSEFGKTRVIIACPFCGDVFDAYVWSLCGSGKKCTGCGALHTSGGSAAPERS